MHFFIKCKIIEVFSAEIALRRLYFLQRELGNWLNQIKEEIWKFFIPREKSKITNKGYFSYKISRVTSESKNIEAKRKQDALKHQTYRAEESQSKGRDAGKKGNHGH
jgi:hypothetical protein